jgi:hypothetical protein
VDTFLLGAFSMGCTLAALAFFSFWRRTRDRLFLWFALSFLIEAVNRFAFVLSGQPDDAAYYYSARLLSYVLLLYAIVEKNWPRRRRED